MNYVDLLQQKLGFLLSSPFHRCFLNGTEKDKYPNYWISLNDVMSALFSKCFVWGIACVLMFLLTVACHAYVCTHSWNSSDQKQNGIRNATPARDGGASYPTLPYLSLPTLAAYLPANFAYYPTLPAYLATGHASISSSMIMCAGAGGRKDRIWV